MEKNQKFKDQVVLITGASSGIGRSTAQAFAREGAKLILASRSEDKLQTLAEEIKQLNQEVLVVPVDVTKESEVRNLVYQSVNRFGQIDILFNNAGSSYVGPVESVDFENQLDRLYELDLKGTLSVTRAILPIMKAHGSGQILNMSSVVGFKAFPGFGAYSSMMHAIKGMTEALRQEVGVYGISVSIIHPALTQTDLLNHVDAMDMPPPFRYMTPMPPEQVARAVIRGLKRKSRRIIVPFQPKLLTLLDSLSSKAGDTMVQLMSRKFYARLLGLYKGYAYHQYEER